MIKTDYLNILWFNLMIKLSVFIKCNASKKRNFIHAHAHINMIRCTCSTLYILRITFYQQYLILYGVAYVYLKIIKKKIFIIKI